MSKWSRHVERWQNCVECELCERRKNVVLARGVVPCDALFVGEAPGQSEDVLGRPFVGPAGRLLDEIVQEAMEGTDLTWAFTNLVACVPLTDGRKTKEPPKESIEACRPRLLEFLDIAKPKLIVCVGSLAHKHLNTEEFNDKYALAHIVHPAAILRMLYAAQGLAIQEAVVEIQDAVEEVWEGE